MKAGAKFRAAFKAALDNVAAFRPNRSGRCEVCDAKPTVNATGLCGPCTWGESETVNGAWWGEDDEKYYKWLKARCERSK